jgi:uncharacterized protein (TIRG00374 family)
MPDTRAKPAVMGGAESRSASTSGSPTPRRARLAWVTGVLLLLAMVLVVTHRAEEEEIAQLLRRAQPAWLLVAAALQALTYVSAAAVWHRALVRHPDGLRLREIVPLGLAKLFTDQALPSAGVSGTLLVVRSFRRRGVPNGRAVAAVLLGLLGFYVSFLIATLGAVAILWREGELRLLILVPAGVLCLLAAGLPLGVLLLRRRAARSVPGWIERLPGVRELAAALQESSSEGVLVPRLLLEATLLQLAIFVLDALTLDAALRAVGTPGTLAVAFASFVVGSLVATLGMVPGGLGTFEAACVAVLHLHGVSVEAALAGTLLLRALSFWLPMLPGFAIARRELGAASAEGGS